MKTIRLFAALCLLAASALHAQTATQLWANVYAGPANTSDLPRGVVVDGAGNVFVTGLSDNKDFYTAKYDGTTGTLLWEKIYNNPLNTYDKAEAIAVDAAGNVAVTGQSGSSIYTAKYAGADGNLIWEKTDNAAGYSNAVAFDSVGNVIVTGEASSPNGYSVYTAKYAAANGALLWNKKYAGLAGSYSNFGTAIAVDGSDNVVVTGSSEIGLTNVYDYYTAKYAAANGSLLWEKRYNGPNNLDDKPRGLAIDAFGNVVVTGFSRSSTNDSYTVKYAAADGSLLWEKRRTTTGAYAVAFDAAGNVVVTGDGGIAGNPSGYYTAKYAAADGSLLWEKSYSGPGDQSDVATSVAVDASGNVVVGGTSTGSTTSRDFYTAKYAAVDGSLLWEARYPGPGPGTTSDFLDGHKQLALTLDGGAVIVGASSDFTQIDFVTVRYAPPPFYQWKVTHLGDAAAPNNGDSDSDGLRTILEYATGADPLVPSALPLVGTSASKSTLTFSRSTAATDVKLTVQGSDNLTAWTDLARSTNGAAMVALVAGVTVNETGSGALRTVEVRDLYLTTDPAHPRRFLRLQAAP